MCPMENRQQKLTVYFLHIIFREVLLVTETKEQRKHWVEKLQAQNPDLLEANHHRPAINPDTPQLPHKILSHGDSSPPTTSVSPLTTCVSAVNHEEGSLHDYHVRPGSPRHYLHRPSTESHDSLHLDIQHLNIGEGVSDVEDN